MVFIKSNRILHAILIILFFSDLLQALQSTTHYADNIVQAKQDKHNHIMCITIPKCGTHLFVKCLALFNLKNVDIFFEYNQKPKDKEAWLNKRMKEAIKTNKKLAPDYDRGNLHIPSVGVLPPQYIINSMQKSQGKLVLEHWPYTKQSEQFFNRHTNANFFIIRDPRDMLVSMAFFLHKGPDDLVMKVDDLIFDFIDGRKQHFVPWGVGTNSAYPLLYEHGITEFYKLYLPWMKARKFCTVKFENLVGSKGGGSDAAQLLELKKIADHLGVKLTGKQAKNIIDNLYGQTSTFREGQIGSWKRHFTPEMKTAYKKVHGACQLLIALGYEKDMNW